MRILVTQATPNQPVTADSEEVMRLQRQLLAEQQAKRDLQHQVDTLTREIAARHSSEGKGVSSHTADIREKLSAAEEHAAVLQSHLLDVQEKWKSAEDKAFALAKQLAAKAKELEAALRPTGGRTSLILIAVVMAAIGTLAGYALGHRTPHIPGPSNQLTGLLNDQKVKIDQLNQTISTDQAQIETLKSQVDSANQTAATLNNEITKRTTQQANTQRKLEQVQNVLQTERQQGDAALNNLRAQLQSKSAQASNFQQEATAASAKLAALQARYPNWNYAGVRVGTFQWDGELKDKDANIVIDLSGVHANTAKIPSTKGSLPSVSFAWKKANIRSNGKKVTALLEWSIF